MSLSLRLSDLRPNLILPGRGLLTGLALRAVSFSSNRPNAFLPCGVKTSERFDFALQIPLRVDLAAQADVHAVAEIAGLGGAGDFELGFAGLIWTSQVSVSETLTRTHSSETASILPVAARASAPGGRFVSSAARPRRANGAGPSDSGGKRKTAQQPAPKIRAR